MYASFDYREPVPVVALLAALAGVSAAVVSLFVSNPYPRVVGPFVFLGAAGWLVLRDREFAIGEIALPSGYLLGAYLWWMAATVLLYVSAGYQRTTVVHLALLGLLVLALATVVVTESNGLRLSVLAATGVVQRATVYYASSLQIGNDAVWHTRMAAEIATTGTLEPLAAAGSKYWFMPLHHLLIAGVSSVAGVSERHAAFLAVTVPLVVVPVLTIYAVLAALGNRTVGVVAAWLYLVADRPIGQSIHLLPTSTGVVFAAVALVAMLGFLYRDSTPHLVVFFLALTAQWFTHPISLFVTGVLVTAFVVGCGVWDRSVGKRGALLTAAVVAAIAAQNTFAMYRGPGSGESILDRILRNLEGVFSGGGGRGAGLPEGAEFVVSSSDTLSIVQLLGVGFLFGVGVLGALVWLSKTSGRRWEVIVGLGTVVTAMAVAIFVPPIFGINLLFPYRWFSYLYVPLAVLVAAGVVAMATAAGGRRTALVVLALVAVATPYAAAMSWNGVGSLEDPVVNDSPTSQRLSATPTEAATYQFVTTYGSGESVVGDRIAANYIERGFRYPASTYGINYSTGASTADGNHLFVDRAYAHTDHASYDVKYRGRWYAVFGPLPVDRGSLAQNHSVVYAAGDDRVVYVSDDSAS